VAFFYFYKPLASEETIEPQKMAIHPHAKASLAQVIVPLLIIRSSIGFSVVEHRLDGASHHNTGQPNAPNVIDTTSVGSLTVPRVGIGTISWSSDKVTELENLDLQVLVNTACQSNAAFFDTAERYGGNWKTALGLGWGETEMLTNKFLQRSGPIKENSTPVVATKFTPSPWRTTAQSVVDACEQSRQRLGVDKIDLYQLHMPDIVQPLRFMGLGESKDELYWDGFAECYHRGLVANVGVCNYGPTLLVKCQEALAKRGVPLASNQIAYSLIGRHNGAQETVDKCNELGIRVLAFFPFAMGLLTGKYTSGMSVAETSLTASRKTKFELKDLTRYAIGDGIDIPRGGIGPLLTVMETIAKSRGKTIAQVALNYIICKGAIPIPGARNKAQLEDNIGAMGWRLTDTEVAMLEFETDNLGIGFEGAGFKRTSEKFVGYGVEKWDLD
jgi:pyridoxine 4-dehydrogenase